MMTTCTQDSDRVFGPRVDPRCRNLDFTLTFEDLVLSLLPAVVFILLSPFRVIPLIRKKRPKIPSHSRLLLATKWCTLTALLAAHVAFLILRCTNPAFDTSSALTADIVNLVATGLVLTLSFVDYRYSYRPATLSSLYLSAWSLLGIARTRTLWLIAPRTSIAIAITIALGLTVVALLLEPLELVTKYSSLGWDLAPEQLSGFWTRTIFAWLWTTLRAGYSREICQDDLPILDTKLRSRHLRQKLLAAWAKYDPQARNSLLRACIRSNFFSFLSPTINLVSQKDPDANFGKALIGAWAIVYLGIAVSTSVYQYQNYRLVSRIRGGLVAQIYQRTLQTRTSEMGEVTAITLMGTDVERLANGMKVFHEVWGSLLDIAIATWLLALQLSVSTLAPLVLVLAFVGVTSKLSLAVMTAQISWVQRVQTRLRATSAMLSDMKTVKMTGLTDVMSKIIQSLRLREIQTSSTYRKLMVVMLLLSLTPINLAPVLTFAIYVIVALFWKKETLLVAQAFSSVALISLLTTPVVVIIQALPQVVQCLGILGRIQEFCNYSGSLDTKGNLEISEGGLNVEADSSSSGTATAQLTDMPEKDISYEGRSFSWSKSKHPVLKNLNINIQQGEVTAIIGPVGSGKSALLKSLLGDLVSLPEGSGKNTEQKCLKEPMAYCAQQPWLENVSIRQNIIGVSQYDQRWYSTVVSACALDTDIEQLEHGDQTNAGSAGLSLSGGQKQRIALARAVYSRCRLVLLDDAFSGMDVHTTDTISSRLLGSHGLLRNQQSTVVLTTHSTKIMIFASYIVILEAGQVMETGSPSALLQSNGYLSRLGMNAPFQGEIEVEKVPQALESSPVSNSETKDTTAKGNTTPSDPRRKNGDISVYSYYISSAGYVSVALYTFFIILWTFSTDFSTVILKWWSEANATEPNQDVGMWLGIYALLGVLGTLGAGVAAWFAFVSIITNTGIHLHTDLLHTTLKSSFRFLVDTDHGEILNRFSQDLELIDMDLLSTMVNYTSTAVSCLIKLIILAIFSQYLGVAIPFVAAAIYFIQLFYLKTSRQVRLLAIEARAPLYTQFTESVDGAATIRAFGWQSHYEERCHNLIDASQRPTYLQSCIQHWLGTVLDLLVTVLSIALVGTVVTWHGRFSPGSVGVGLVIVIDFSSILRRLIVNWTNLESSVGAVARIKRFQSDTQYEKTMNRTADVPLKWPHSGAVDFKNVSASYGSDGNPTLKNLSLKIEPGQHIAICGRTGSGKTSLILSLLQMINIQGGQILVDSIDISTVSYEEIRRRLNVVPQDTFLLPGTIRSNIDPFGSASDDDISQALAKVGLQDIIQEQGGLGKDMDTSAWSDGQKRLLCLARAIVRKGKIVVLDEVASSLDKDTESTIQEIINTEFRNCTVIAVMHRLDHVLRYDMVALMGNGVVLEHGRPVTLIDSGGQFADLYNSNGS
ncbi:ABC transporter [Xylaria venustula]|nr:ABC transporter [Xylaria venustula]